MKRKTSNEISWVTPRIGITDMKTSKEHAESGTFMMINIANEESIEQATNIPLEPFNIRKNQLHYIANWIENSLLNKNGRVLVNCMYGIDSSPLAVAWYLYIKRGLTKDAAYEKIMRARPQINVRWTWIRDSDPPLLIPDA